MPGVRTIKDGAAWIAGEQGKHFCRCGCGLPIQIKIHHHSKGVPRYVLNHNRELGERRRTEKLIGVIPVDAPPLFQCGHKRILDNAYFFKNGRYRCRLCSLAQNRNSSYRFTERSRLVKRVGAKRYNRRVRTEMIIAYGGCCQCCGESAYEFLTLEHINGGGNAERRLYGGGQNSGGAATRIIARLRRQGWPKGDYTVLCANCNMATKSGKICPHQSSLSSRVS